MTSDDLITFVSKNTGSVALTLAVLLIALVAGPLLASHSSRVPGLVEAVRSRNGHSSGAHLDEHRSSGSRWLGRVTLLSIWIAALFAIGLIWFGASGLSPKEMDALGATARQVAVDIGASLLVLALTLVVARLLQRSVSIALLRGRMNVNLVRLTGRVVYATTIVFGGIVILAIWNTGLALPVTLAGALTVALTLALQDILKNLVAGVYLLVERPFVIGDQISIAPYSGQVEDIQMRVTVLRTPDDQRVLVPNAMLFMSAVVNQTFYNRRRAALTVTIADDRDKTDEVEERILQALKGVPDILQTDPTPETTLNGAIAGKLMLRVVFWMPTMSPIRQAGVISDAIEQVRAQLPEAEIASAESVAT